MRGWPAEMRKPRLSRKLASSHQFGVAKGGWLSLHLAPDHLLLRSTFGFSEQYRRFYFTDIEAITICKTVRGIFVNAALVFGVFFSLMPIVVTRGPHRVAWIFAGIFALLLIVNVLLGPTCQTQLQTRVQTRALPLRRVPKAQRVIEQVAARIMAAQADLPTASPATADSPPPAAPLSRGHSDVPPPLPGEPAPAASWLYLAVFALLVCTAAIALASALQPGSPMLAYLTYGGALANLGLAIVTLVKHRGRRVALGHSPIALTSLVGHGVALPFIYFTYSIVYTVQAVSGSTPGAAPPAMWELPISELRDLPGFTQVLAIYGLCALLLGLTGFVLFVANGITRKPAPGA